MSHVYVSVCIRLTNNTLSCKVMLLVIYILELYVSIMNDLSHLRWLQLQVEQERRPLFQRQQWWGYCMSTKIARNCSENIGSTFSVHQCLQQLGLHVVTYTEHQQWQWDTHSGFIESSYREYHACLVISNKIKPFHFCCTNVGQNSTHSCSASMQKGPCYPFCTHQWSLVFWCKFLPKCVFFWEQP